MGNTRACNAGSAATTHLYINSNRIQSNDVDRMTTAGCSCSNCGWGLGTSYDNSNGNGHTVRPRCDAQFHVDNTWGHTYAAGGQSGDVDRIPGIIGTDSYGCGMDSLGAAGSQNPSACSDVTCERSGQCPWSKISSYSYDYAIYVSDLTA